MEEGDIYQDGPVFYIISKHGSVLALYPYIKEVTVYPKVMGTMNLKKKVGNIHTAFVEVHRELRRIADNEER